MQTKNIANRTVAVHSASIDDIENAPRSVVAMAREYPAGHLIAYHRHPRSQFLYASSGVMTVITRGGIWVVPPLRAVWIPAHTRHQIQTSGTLSMRSLFIDAACFPDLPEDCRVLAVSPLLKELILYAVSLPLLYPLRGPEQRLMRVIIDQIRSMDITPLELSVPHDPRLMKIYDRLCANPADKRSIEDWGKLVGATGRTLARQFKRETGMGFGQWRQQIRILEALKRLGLGETVTAVAIELGYDSTSAFISMFKKSLGKTPGQYFAC
jgi:AraC-like DNA-binding protein/mannose-6-phosphate isomerase-like protein (cupin superfamily)